MQSINEFFSFSSVKKESRTFVLIVQSKQQIPIPNAVFNNEIVNEITINLHEAANETRLLRLNTMEKSTIRF